MSSVQFLYIQNPGSPAASSLIVLLLRGIGYYMTASTVQPSLRNQYALSCPGCHLPVEPQAHFCGECGTAIDMLTRRVERQAETSARFQEFPDSHNEQPSSGPPQVLPNFVKVKDQRVKVDPELAGELGQLLISLLRERLFLIMHWLIFLAANMLGFFLAGKCYYEFNGDELSRLVMASTPLLFVNSVALVSLAPIKGTKREIARLNERIAYVKFMVRYKDLL